MTALVLSILSMTAVSFCFLYPLCALGADRGYEFGLDSQDSKSRIAAIFERIKYMLL